MKRVRELIEGRGCELLVFLASYSPDLNPIEEEGFSKIKGLLRKKAKARSFESLSSRPPAQRSLTAVTKEDARGFFAHCGYGTSRRALSL